MDKTTSKSGGKKITSQSIKDEADKALGTSGTRAVRIREDGAVCFGDDCVIIKPAADGTLDLEVDPSSCGTVAGKKVLEHLISTAGKGVNIKVHGIITTE